MAMDGHGQSDQGRLERPRSTDQPSPTRLQSHSVLLRARREFHRVIRAGRIRASSRGGFEYHARCGAGLVRLDPARRAQAPLIARFETGEAVFGVRCREIVADAARELEELARGLHAHAVHTEIRVVGAATTVAEEPGQWWVLQVRSGPPRTLMPRGANALCSLTLCSLDGCHRDARHCIIALFHSIDRNGDLQR